MRLARVMRVLVIACSARPDVLWIKGRAQRLDPRANAWGDVALCSPSRVIGVGKAASWSAGRRF